MKAKGIAVLLLLLIVGGGGLFAQTASILLIPASEEAVVLTEEFEELLKESIPTIGLNTDRRMILTEYAKIKAEQTFLKEQVQSYVKKQDPKPQKEIEPIAEPFLPITYQREPYDTFLIPLLKNENALHWYFTTKEALGALVFDVTPFGQAKRVNVLFVEGTTHTPIYDTLLISGDEKRVQEEILAHVLNQFSDGREVLLRLVGSKEISFKEKPIRKIESLDLYVVSHELTQITAQRRGYLEQMIPLKLIPGTVTTIQPQLVGIESDPITLLSSVGSVKYAVHNQVGESSMITLGSPTYPLVVALEKDGFVPGILQLPREGGAIIRFGLRKASVDVLNEQKRLYHRALSTILSFGSYVVTQALINTYDPNHDNPMWSLALASTRFLSIVSSVAVIAELSSYVSAVDMMQQ